jgi:hypothetical protein
MINLATGLATGLAGRLVGINYKIIKLHSLYTKKMVLHEVINEFLELDGDDYNVVKISEVKGSRIIKYISSYFVGTLKKVVYIPEKLHKHAGFIIRNMMNTVMGNVGIDVRYSNKLFNHFARWFLGFQKFIEKYDIPEKYFKEYYYAAFSGLFILIFGKIKNFKLYDTIVRLWIIVDNIFGSGIDFGERGLIWKKDVYDFFVGGAFENREKRLEFLRKSEVGGPIIECFKDIEEMRMSEKKKDGLYLRFYKLFRFSYEGGDGGRGRSGSEFEILKNSCLKTKKGLDIFFYAIDYQKKKEDAYKIFHLSFIVQLLDDLMDIRKDKLEGSVTIFSGGGVKENTKNAVRLFQLIQNSRIIRENSFQILYECLMFLILDLNEEFFEPEFIEKIRRECPVMDLKYYNMRELDSIVESEIMKKILCIYLK